MRRSWRIAAIALFTLALALGGLLGDRLLAVTDETRDSLRLYTELINLEHDRYGAEVSYKDLVYSSVNGMLRSLDPHTAFLNPEAYEGMREKQQTSFYGLGILVGVRNGQLTVISPLEGTPAARLGIQAGDVISTIEGEPTETMTLDEAVGKLKGPKGTQVKISITRRGLPQPLTMSVTRAEIPQTTVRQSYMLNPTTGYIQLTEFARGSGREMADAIEKLRGSGMKQLVLDLRNNGGGLLDQAIDIADQFLPEGSMIVQTKGRTRDSFQSYRADGKYPALDAPVVVLVNEGTASASEILSGALQDHDRGLIVGTPSWGKGLVQTVYNLSYGAGLALTTAKYYTPSGRLIQRDYTSYFDYYTHADAGSPEITGKAVDPKDIFHTGRDREGPGALSLRAVPAGPQRLPQLRGGLRQPQQGDGQLEAGPGQADRRAQPVADQGEAGHPGGDRQEPHQAGGPRQRHAPDPRRGGELHRRPGGPAPRALRRRRPASAGPAALRPRRQHVRPAPREGSEGRAGDAVEGDVGYR